MADEGAVKVLQRFFLPEFVRLAVNLPPSCTFWSVVEEEIEARVGKDNFTESGTEEVLQFLAGIFSSYVVETVEKNFGFLSRSSLGLSYTLRKGKGEVARGVLLDIEDFPPLRQFSGWVSLSSQEVFAGDGEAAASASSSGSKIPRRGGSGKEFPSRRPRGSRGEEGGGGREIDDGIGGSGSGSDNNFGAVHFPTMEENTVIVDMSAFSTPPKEEFDRSCTLRARSREFAAHCNVTQEVSNITRIYNPFSSVKGRVRLYHGTRTSSLALFKGRGILPPPSKNEFSIISAFYVTNSICQAFEHPMHKHVFEGMCDPVSVMVFEVDVAALHGEKIPMGETSKFKVKWYPADTPERVKIWSDFCASNMSRNLRKMARPHDYDLVIGPICMGVEGRDYKKLYVQMPGLTPTMQPATQVALCTERARAWLQRCFKRVYAEKRN